MTSTEARLVPQADLDAIAAARADATEALMVTEAESGAAGSGGPRILFVNEAFTAMTGYRSDQVVGRTPRLLQCADTDRAALERLGAAVRNVQPAAAELVNVRADGSRFWVHLDISPVTDDRGRLTNWVGVHREVTDRHPQPPPHRPAETTDDQLSSAFCDAPIGMAITTPAGVLLRVNAELRAVLGRTETELLGADLFRYVHADDLAAAYTACSVLRDGSQVRTQLECRLRHSAGHYLFAQVTTSRVDDAAGAPKHLVMHLQDTSEQAGLQAEMTRQALHDGLTGLPNRTLFLDRLTQAIGRARRDGSTFGVFFCDLDDFKAVNDSLGHAAGDQVIVAVAGRLQSLLRPGDTAARLGGDEFTALCEHIDLAGAERIAERLEAALSAPIRCGDDTVRLSVSTGLVIGGRNDIDAAGLLRNADTAMYIAKGAGRARHVAFQPGMNREAVSRRRVETALRDAIDVDQFQLWYQPIVDLGNGRVSAVEALLRWQHPSRGVLAPRDFLGVAEDSGLLVPIGEWVLDRAAAQAREWLDRESAGAPAQRWVLWSNVSARQLNPGLVRALQRVIARHGLPVGTLGLELTESVVMHDLPVVRPLLEQLAALGVRLAIGDFGTGYSSLAYLAQLPVDVVKIDRSFTAQLAAGGRGAAVVTAVLALAAALGMETIVEGVETAGQLQVLRELGAPAAQGHHLARPAPAGECSPPGSALLPH